MDQEFLEKVSLLLEKIRYEEITLFCITPFGVWMFDTLRIAAAIS